MFLRVPTRRLLTPLTSSGDVSATLHTSACASAQAQLKRGGFGLKASESGSRKKLAADLTPRSKGAGRLEVAPSETRQPREQSSPSVRRSKTPPRTEFVRDSLPHPEAKADNLQRKDGVDGRTLIDEELRPRRPDRYVARRAFEERGVLRDRRGRFSQPSGRGRSEERMPWDRRGERSSIHEDREQMLASNPPTMRRHVSHPISAFKDDFETSTRTDTSNLATRFTSPPLLPGLATSCHELLGENARPTPIQALAIKHLVVIPSEKPRQVLLASETGSGKSIAYLLPLLQALKKTESTAPAPLGKRAVEPRALILAPTHELSRQLAGSAKTLTHIEKLRVLCASRANDVNVSTKMKGMTASQMSSAFDRASVGQEFSVTGAEGTRSRPVDVLVGTPMKILEMIHGRGWDRKDGRRGPPEMGLGRVEWVIVDEADVLFDPDFQETIRKLLADISGARGQPVSVTSTTPPEKPVDYPFNLVLTSATIPSSLASYLDTHLPNMTRLASPKLHKLPSSLKTEHVPYTGGNRLADIERRLREVWSEDAQLHRPKGKIVIFCNKGTKVEALGEYLTANGVPNVALTGSSEARHRGSNKHLDGFLKTASSNASEEYVTANMTAKAPAKETPHVLITTSLLSRGLDFAPDIRHVFIADSPRNMIDFLHRAGRSGRAGQEGKVVVFGKLSGRGSEEGRDVRRKVRSFAA